MRGAFGVVNAAGTTFGRVFAYGSNTTVSFASGYRLDTGGSGNNICIPTKIVGVK